MSGKPIFSAASVAASASGTGPPLHGAIGTPTLSAMRLDSILSPSRCMVSEPGPTNVIPRRSHRAANSARSETKPQPGQTASARRATSTRSSSARSR